MMKHVVAIISCAVGILFGTLGAGMIGGVVGAITGLGVGYAYMAVVLYFWESKPLRFLVGIFGGTVAGGLSGMSVHVPSLIGIGKPIWGSTGDGIFIGGVFGLCVGTVLGLILGIIFINTELYS